VIKAFTTDSGSLGGTPAGTGVPFWVAVTAVIGFAMWGNEPDVWRFGKPSFWWPLPAFLFAGVWFLLFTMGGWMMAQLAGKGDPYNFSVHYSLFGAFWIAFIIATISQFAINDGNYYESVNAGQNLLGGVRGWRRPFTCLLVAAGGALAGYLVNYKFINGWFDVATFLAITVPCATVIMVVDHFLLPRIYGISRPLLRVPSWQEAGVFNIPAVVSLLVAVIYGSISSAILPGNLGYNTPRNWGPIPLECWLIAGVLYVALVAVFRDKRALAFSKPALETNVPAGAIVDIASEAEAGGMPVTPAPAAGI
jgi:hypothetical protein